MEQNYLFSEQSLSELTRDLTTEIREEISHLSAEEIKDENFHLIISRLVASKTLTLPILDEVNVETKNEDAQIEMDPYLSMGRGGKTKGVRITFFVPFKGDAKLFLYRPSTSNSNPPIAKIENNELLLSYTHPLRENVARDARQQYDATINSIKWYLDKAGKDVAIFNNSLAVLINEAVARRKAEIEKSLTITKDLGFKPRK